MTWDEVIKARQTGGVLMLPVGRPYGVWRDWMMDHAKNTRASRLLWTASRF
ncbi:L-alanine exporter AlaE [Agrobacterium sp. Ap1]|nr:L-alanine exporter AlaE [Agrobacterium sp. Ap1]